MHCPDGEIGRHRRLKISRLNRCVGSSPTLGTTYILSNLYEFKF